MYKKQYFRLQLINNFSQIYLKIKINTFELNTTYISYFT